MSRKNKILKYIGKNVEYDSTGQYIWATDKDNGNQHLLTLRGWGAIRNMFKSETNAAEFQDDLGQFIVDAINEKVARENPRTSKGMKKIEIYQFQLKEIQNALRMTSNHHNCKTKETCFDRTVTKAKKMAENALNGKIDEHVPHT